MPPDVPRVSTPPLAEPVPLDTPRFADLGKENLLHPVLVKTITENMKFDHMMPVQAATLHDLLEKRIDILGQAKTGTGKTIAFLLPAIQTMLNKNRGTKSGISLLVISPTRELAMQIAKEASMLLQNLPQFRVSFAIGGTNKEREERAILSKEGCDILIATPGRLYDHLSNERVRNAFRNLDTLVLDEADRLLDMGFMAALKDIIKCLPDKEATQRQGMLFSATIAPHVEKFAHLVLNKQYKFTSTIPKGEANNHERIPQLLVTVPSFHNVAPALVSAIRSEMKLVGKDRLKAIVFAPTACLADWYQHILASLGDLPEVLVLHSKLSQGKRTNTTEAFRKSTSSILVATDVVARGMDFPNVSNVFQAGLPADKESYIHRLGRTGRAGKEGRAFFIVTESEAFFPKFTLREINFQSSDVDYTTCVQEVEKAAISFENKAKVYQAWLGYYKNYLKQMRWDLEKLVDEGNQFAFKALISGEVPGIPKSTIGKMGLRGVRGLKVIANLEKPARGNGAGRGGSNNRGGGEGRSAGNGGQGAPKSIPRENAGGEQSRRGGAKRGAGGGKRGAGGGKRGGFRGEQRGPAGPPGALKGPGRDSERLGGW
jgi:ATP-dependent RNA helicase MSS116